MIVSEFIEWLKTMPQDAVVEVLDHHSGSGYYDQGGNCYIEQFTPELEYPAGEDYCYGKHFELSTYKGVKTLQIGVKDK